MSNDNFIDALSVLTALHPTLPREQGHALYVLMQHAMADREKRAQAAQGVRVADIGFRRDGEAQQHVPNLLLEFDPVPFNGPTDAKGWKDRDTMAHWLSTEASKPVQAEAPRCSYPQCTGEQPADGSCCKQPFTSAMADAAERYWRAVGPNAHPLPAQFRWVDCFRAMEAAAPSPKASNPVQVAQDGDLLALLEEVSRHYTREDDLPDNLLPRIDAAIDAARTRGEGA